MTNQDNSTEFCLGSWQIEPVSNRLLRHERTEEILRPKVMQLLQYLAAQGDRTVTREEIIEHIWQGNHYIGDRGLTDAIWQLRKILDQDESRAPFIETVPKIGYRLLVKPDFEKHYSQDKKQLPLNSPNNKVYAACAALITAFAVFFFTQSLEPNTASMNMVPKSLTQLPGKETSPAFSPDGKYLAYTHIKSDRSFELHVLEYAEKDADPIIIQSEQDIIAASTWSKDSQELAYITATRRKTCEIRRLSLITRKETVVTQCNHRYLSGLSWSPNGRYFAYGDALLGEPAIQGVAIYDQLENRKIQLTTGKSDFPHMDINMAWAPDGSKVAFVRTKGVGNSDIFTVTLDGKIEQVTNRQSSLMGYAWLDDSRSLIVSEHVSNRTDLYHIDVKSGKASMIPTAGFNAAFPAYNRKTKTMAFSKRSFDVGLYAVNKHASPDSIRMKPVFESPSADIYPDYSSVNNQYVFISDRSGHDEVWIADTDGENALQITELKTAIFSPTWSSDGKYIAFTASGNEQNFKQIYIYDVVTKDLKQITSSAVDHWPPNWSEKGDFLYVATFVDGADVQLWKVDLNGNKTPLPGESAMFAREAKHINGFYYTRFRHNGIWLYNRDTQNSIQVIEDSGSVDGSNWVVTDEGIFYTSRKKNFDEINYYEFISESHSNITKLPSSSIAPTQTFTYNSQLEQLVFVQTFKPQSDIYLVSYP